MKIKRILKQAIVDQYRTISFTTINFYSYVHPVLLLLSFPSSRVISLTSYFMILLVLIFIVNQNFKLLNQHSILLLFSFVVCSCHFAFCIFFLLFVLLLSYSIIIILLFTYCYLLTYLFIYSYLLYHLFIYFVVLTCTYKVSPFKSSPHVRFTTSLMLIA